MMNFEFYNPVKILFGEGEIENLSQEIPKDSKILMTYGGGSIKQNGVYNQVISALAGFNVVEFGGIEANPKFETLMKAVEVVREKNIDFLLAVGGGSVIDGTKFISAAVDFKGDPWDILTEGSKVVIENVLPIGTVLTIAATGSEMNSGGVISRKSTGEKLPFGNPLLYPKFSILDPTTTFSLPQKQVANGIIDAYVHVTEQYLTYPLGAHVQDRWAEGLLQVLIEIGPQAINEPHNYNIRASMMWACTMALNGIIGVGVPNDWATHMIGHELTAFFGIDHAESLAVILPPLLNETREEKKEKILQYGARVWGVVSGDEKQRIDETISKTETFFRLLGAKTHLAEHGITKGQLEPIFNRFFQRKWKLGEKKSIDSDRIERILLSAI